MKKIGLILLSLILLLSATACGGNEKVRQYDGQTIIVYKAGYGDYATENDLVLAEIQKRFKEDTGLDIDFQIKFVPFTEAQQRYSSAAIKKDKFDVMQGVMGTLNLLSPTENDAKLFADLSERVNTLMPNYVKVVGQNNINQSIRYDKTCGLPGRSNIASYWMTYRKDIIDDQWGLNLAGVKTLAEFEAVMDAIIAKDPKIVPLSGPGWAIDRIVKSLAELPEIYHQSPYLDKGANLDSADDDVVKLNAMHPNFPEYIGIYRRWMEKGYISKDAVNMQQETGDQMYLSGKSLIKADWMSNMIVNDTLDFSKQDSTKNAIIDVVPLISGVKGNVVVAAENTNSMQMMAYSYGNSEAIDLFCKYTNWVFADPENYKLVNYGIEGVHFEMVKETIEIIGEDGKATQKEYEIMKPFDKYLNLGERGPYTGLYSFFTIEDDEWRRYTTEQGARLIHANNLIETAAHTVNEMEPYHFDMSEISTKATEAYNIHLSICDSLKNNLASFAGFDGETYTDADTAIAKLNEKFTTGVGSEYINEMTKQWKEKYAPGYYNK